MRHSIEFFAISRNLLGGKMKKIIPFLFILNPFTSAIACETQRELFIENTSTKVWRTTICPHQKLPFHNHQFARVVIPEESGKLKVIYKSGHSYIMNLKKDQPTFLSLAQGKELHQDLNIGLLPLHVMVVELKTNQ